MDKIVGVNLGNWLVLEKWMSPLIFEGTDAEDEDWLNRLLPYDEIQKRMTEHRDTYVTEKDFENIASHGMNLVRIPVPYFIFGDRPPFIGCIEYLDKAFVWAEKHNIKILIDLHTVPGSQNGYDNGGLIGVCKWHKNKPEVQFALSVLERLGERYAQHKALFGIEVLNEPISFSVYWTAPSTGKARDKNEAKGSGYIPMSFLKRFYRDAYYLLRKHLGEDKVIVFHDGFRLGRWGKFFRDEGMKNVMLDTHIYIFAMEIFVPIHSLWAYRLYMKYNEKLLKRVSRYIPVVVGEWSISNKWALKYMDNPEECRNAYQQVAELQKSVWNKAAGHIFWNYQLYRDKDRPLDAQWKNGWDICRCWDNGWMV